MCIKSWGSVKYKNDVTVAFSLYVNVKWIIFMGRSMLWKLFLIFVMNSFHLRDIFSRTRSYNIVEIKTALRIMEDSYTYIFGNVPSNL
jgi:hypothetical protein